MFEVGKHYRHRNTLDVDIKVLAVQLPILPTEGHNWTVGLDQDEVGLRVRYWNRTSGFFLWRRIPGDMDEYVVIKKKDFKNWKEVPREKICTSPA